MADEGGRGLISLLYFIVVQCGAAAGALSFLFIGIRAREKFSLPFADTAVLFVKDDVAFYDAVVVPSDDELKFHLPGKEAFLVDGVRGMVRRVRRVIEKVINADRLSGLVGLTGLIGRTDEAGDIGLRHPF